MALTGSLQDLTVADLIQHYCQDRKTAQLIIDNDQDQVSFYFNEGNIVHAAMDDIEGEEVVYKILGWERGTFKIEMDVLPPVTSITKKWPGLLLEGARRLDENKKSNQDLPEVKTMSTKKKSEVLAEMLADLLADSSDIEGAAIVGNDGLVYSADVPKGKMDENLVGATSAAVLGLSMRSIQQLDRGNFTQTLVQGDNGNIIVAKLNDITLFVGLTSKNVNLGMAFAEVRAMTEKLTSVL